MTQPIAGWLARLTVVLLAAACGSPTPPAPTSPPEPSATAGPTISPPPTGAPSDTTDAAADLLEPADQPALRGIYLPAGMRVRSSDHYAFIQSPTDCDTLSNILDAGQWRVAERLSVPMPTPNPEAGIPAIEAPEWLLLRWADDVAMARLGGDENGCVAQIWRVSRQPVSAIGAFEAEGDASALQLLCLSGGGTAGLSMMYVGPDDLRLMIETAVPLEIGTHPIDLETEISIGRSDVGVFELFQLLAGGLDEDGGGIGEDAFANFFPADYEAGEWEGSVSVTSIDPLIGEINLENLIDERRRSQSLRAGFRCDLPPGQLTLAAAETRQTPPPEPEPTAAPAAGTVVVTVESGRHAGRHEVASTDVFCSYNLMGDNTWDAGYGAPDAPAGEIQTVNVSMPDGGGETSAFVTFGDDFDHDWFNDDAASGEVTDRGDVVEFTVTGTSYAGIAFEVTITCTDIARF